jgi:hypothetical protein
MMAASICPLAVARRGKSWRLFLHRPNHWRSCSMWRQCHSVSTGAPCLHQPVRSAASVAMPCPMREAARCMGDIVRFAHVECKRRMPARSSQRSVQRWRRAWTMLVDHIDGEVRACPRACARASDGYSKKHLHLSRPQLRVPFYVFNSSGMSDSAPFRQQRVISRSVQRGTDAAQCCIPSLRCGHTINVLSARCRIKVSQVLSREMRMDAASARSAKATVRVLAATGHLHST